MLKFNRHTGFAIAVAWPETYCKQAGDWYDKLAEAFRINKHRYYRAGHAALVLVDTHSNQCHYFDFGRYHAPYKHGRVRSQNTDHGLAIQTTPIISRGGKELSNFKEILYELQLNDESHGEGTLHASYTPVNFEKAYGKALELQDQSPIPYGPFKYKGNNCSRFVNDCIVAGQPPTKASLKLKYALVLTPSPLDNIRALKHRIIIPKQLKIPNFVPQAIDDLSILQKTLQEPTRPDSIPTEAIWVSGEGAGSWFHIQEHHLDYRMTRYGPKAKVECLGWFKTNAGKIDLQSPYTIAHISHCAYVTIRQNKREITLYRIQND